MHEAVRFTLRSSSSLLLLRRTGGPVLSGHLPAAWLWQLGRAPSIDLEVVIRLLVVQAITGIRSIRALAFCLCDR